MKIDRINKQITPTTAYEVFDIWLDPSNLDYRSGGDMCANFAAQRYANVGFEEAQKWSLNFNSAGHEIIFRDLGDSYDRYTNYTFELGQDVDDAEQRPLREEDNPILRVAEAFKAKPELFKLVIDEDPDGILMVDLTNKLSDHFTFTILEDYSIFWEFYDWQQAKWRSNAKAAKQASADRFLSRLT
jgi:hypothetical protein